ncbi:linaridin-like RiPP [Streptomyces sp. NPDC017936]|uniref:linaridin-like RiPP n=1 Tax=Streptomyces sp. NPDC017936 TaxID=3365016 RepID=UPI00379E1467
MSLVAQFANESLTDIAPGLLSDTDAARPDSPADPVMATPMIAIEVGIFALELLAANAMAYHARVYG